MMMLISLEGCLGTHELYQLLGHDFDDGLSRCQASEYVLAHCPFLNGPDELLYHAEAYICFQKRHLDFL